ncbi:MAG: DUF2946 domain-containing protein [Haliea sp.]|nr:MAG: DUF2946 domain-containing protein [Haliea sp.]
MRRIWLVLLLALLLPVRGAMAVAMDCSGPAAQVQAQAQGSAQGHDHHASDGGHDHHRAAAHGQPDDAVHDHAGASDKCNLCASSCSVTGMASCSMTLAEPQPVSAVFPRLFAAPPSFFADGQERPPRTT